MSVLRRAFWVLVYGAIRTAEYLLMLAREAVEKRIEGGREEKPS